MPRRSTRTEIIDAADQLFYQQGYEATSFANIAEKVEISRGNFYYHFKTKDQILDAVIAHRIAKTEMMLDNWQAGGDTPVARIRNFIGILITNQDKIKQFGCPVGTLFAELTKLNHSAQEDAKRLFSLFRSWLAVQFRALGKERAEADQLALHLLARSQGIATLATAFPDESFLSDEVAQMQAWLDAQLPPIVT